MKAMLRVFAVVCLLAAGSSTVIAQCDTTSEPCLLSSSYPLPYMHMRYPNRVPTTETIKTEYCDLYAVNSFTWYRSEYDVTTYCVPQDSCGTQYPIWVNGSIPTEADDVVSRTACLRSYTSCCEREYPIKMKHCGYYSVYCFEELPSGCPQRFCFDVDESQITTTQTIRTTSAPTTPAPTTAIATSNCAAGNSGTPPEEANPVVVIVLAVVVSLLTVVILIQLGIIFRQRNKITSIVPPNTRLQEENERPFSGRRGQIPQTPPPSYMRVKLDQRMNDVTYNTPPPSYKKSEGFMPGVTIHEYM